MVTGGWGRGKEGCWRIRRCVGDRRAGGVGDRMMGEGVFVKIG